MSKFYNYLNEKTKLDNFNLEQFKNDCYPYLKSLKKDGYHFLYSGRKSNEIIFKKDIRKNRNPLNTPVKIHKMLDDKFKSKLGVRARSQSIFSHLEEVRTNFYGTPYYIFPTGSKYSLVWNENINDLFTYLDTEINKAISSKTDKRIFGVRISDLLRKFEDNEILRYNENTIRFESPREFMKNTSKEHYERMPSLEKSDFFDILDAVTAKAVSGYNKTKSINKEMDCEVMIVADSVWLIHESLVGNFEFRLWIKENIK